MTKQELLKELKQLQFNTISREQDKDKNKAYYTIGYIQALDFIIAIVDNLLEEVKQ